MKFSITIPAYKRTFLKEAIDSCLAQTYQDFELIIVNDASPEDLDSIVNSYSDDRICYYKNETNIGGKDPVANWNKCLSYARGEFFCLLCDDDMYAPTFIETMLELAEKYPHCNVFKSRVQTIDKDRKVLTYFPSSPEWEPTSDYLWHVAYRHRKQTVSEWVYRTQRMRECGGYAAVPMAWGSDYLSVMLFGAEGGICASIKPLVIFRRSGLNISNNYAQHAMEKLEGTLVYSQKLSKMVEDYGMDDSLYPLIEKIKKSELMATMGVARWRDYIRICIYRKRYGISSKMIGYTLLNRVIRVLR